MTAFFAGALVLLKLCDIVRRQQQLRLRRLLKDLQPGDGQEGVGTTQVFSMLGISSHAAERL